MPIKGAGSDSNPVDPKVQNSQGPSPSDGMSEVPHAQADGSVLHKIDSPDGSSNNFADSLDGQQSLNENPNNESPDGSSNNFADSLDGQQSLNENPNNESPDGVPNPNSPGGLKGTDGMPNDPNAKKPGGGGGGGGGVGSLPPGNPVGGVSTDESTPPKGDVGGTKGISQGGTGVGGTPPDENKKAPTGVIIIGVVVIILLGLLGVFVLNGIPNTDNKDQPDSGSGEAAGPGQCFARCTADSDCASSLSCQRRADGTSICYNDAVCRDASSTTSGGDTGVSGQPALPESGCRCDGTTLVCADGTVAEFNPQCGVGGGSGSVCGNLLCEAGEDSNNCIGDCPLKP